MDEIMDEEKVMEIESEIAGYKQLLAATDYQALKYMEGYISEEEYAPIKAYRQDLRDKINADEAQEIALTQKEA